MNAIEFVKKFGISKAKGITFVMLDGTVNYDGFSVNLNDLKQIVDSFELVEKFGGLNESRKYVDNRILPELSRAINLVDQCNA